MMRVFIQLLAEEITHREGDLFEGALTVEQDEQLNADLDAWDVTIGDGFEAAGNY